MMVFNSNRGFKLSLPTRFFLFGTLLLYLLGYQPALTFPPIRRVQTFAQGISQQSSIQAVALSSGFILPHPGYLSTRYSLWHPGIDLATGLGMPVHPILEGKVVEVVYDFWGLGHHVVVEHQQGYRSTYGHMGRIYIRVGDEVKQSTIMGEVGMSGHTSGPHTHLEITKNGSYIDPLTILPTVSDLPQAKVFGSTAPQGGEEIISTQLNQTEVKIELKKELRFNL